MRISVLPTYLSYDAPWPVRKIPLRCTVHYVSYHVESKASLLSRCSTKRGCAADWKFESGSRPHAITRLTPCIVKRYWLWHLEKVWGWNPLERGEKSMWVTLKSLVFDVKFLTVGFSRQVYAVCTSVKELCTRIPRMTGEEKEYENIERGRDKLDYFFTLLAFNHFSF